MWWLLLLTLFALLLVLFLDKWLKHEEFEKIPGPRGIFVFENALDFIMDPVKLFYYIRKLANVYKNLFKVKLGTKKFIAIYHPEDVEVVISGTKNNCKGFLYSFIEPWLNEGLLLSKGKKWYQRRKILTPTFHFNILRAFYTIIEESTKKFINGFQSEVGKSQTDMSSFISDFTLNSICETAMGTKLDEETSDIGRNYKMGIQKLGVYAVYRAQRVWMYPNLIFSCTKVGQKQKKLLKDLSEFRDNVVNLRRKSSKKNDFKNVINELNDGTNDEMLAVKKRFAMLDLLLQAEKSGVIDAKGIGEEVDTFMFEGHDTTATALMFAFMLLANYQECQNKILEECNEIFGSKSRSATMADLSQMKYLECCIKESLRLYPPVHFIGRKVTESMQLKNYSVPAGTDCVILIYDLHRRSDQFSDPLEFRPERFLMEPTWHPYAYIPFSAGPRNCIGQKFAMMEMKLAISALVRRYRLLPVTKPKDIVMITDFILRPKHPIYVKFENRSHET